MTVLFDTDDRPIEIAQGRGDLRYTSQPFHASVRRDSGQVKRVGMTPVSYANLFATQPWVAAAVMRMLTWSVRVPLKVYRRENGGETRKRLEPADHPLARMVKRPWLGHSASPAKLAQALLGPTLVHGNTVCEVEVIGGEEYLKPLDWRYVSPLGPASGYEIEGWRYEEGDKTRHVPTSQAIHVAWWSPLGPLGVSPLEQLGVTVATEDAAQRYQKSIFGNAARPPSAITSTPEFLELEKADRNALMAQLRQDVDEVYAGPENAGKPAVLPPGLDWKPIGHSANEAELIAQRQVAREEVAAVYQIPQPMMGILDHATYSNIEVQREMAYTMALGPPLVLIEQTLTATLARDYFGEEDLFLEYDFGPVMRGDREKEITMFRDAIGTGIMTMNEARRALNMEASDEEDAEKLFYPANNLKPLGSPIEDPNAAPAPVQRADVKGEEKAKASVEILGQDGVTEVDGKTVPVFLRFEDGEEVLAVFNESEAIRNKGRFAKKPGVPGVPGVRVGRHMGQEFDLWLDGDPKKGKGAKVYGPEGQHVGFLREKNFNKHDVNSPRGTHLGTYPDKLGALKKLDGMRKRRDADKAASALDVVKLKSIDGRLSGGNTSDVFKGTTENGKPVVIKNRVRATTSKKRNHPDQDFERGLEHSDASGKVAEHLGLKHPKVAIRNRDDLGGAAQGSVQLRKRSDEDEAQSGLSTTVELQEFRPGIARVRKDGVPGATFSEDQAEAMQVFDYIVGATDRWNGNLYAADDALLSMDHDRTFPNATRPRGGGNITYWVDPDGKPIAGRPLSPAMKAKLEEIAENRDDWDKRLAGTGSPVGGLTEQERKGFFNRLDDVLESGTVPEPTDLTQENTKRFGIFEAQYGVEGAGAPLVGEVSPGGKVKIDPEKIRGSASAGTPAKRLSTDASGEDIENASDQDLRLAVYWGKEARKQKPRGPGAAQRQQRTEDLGRRAQIELDKRKPAPRPKKQSDVQFGLKPEENKIGKRVVWGAGKNKRRGKIVSVNPTVIEWEKDGGRETVDPKELRLSKTQK